MKLFFYLWFFIALCPHSDSTIKQHSGFADYNEGIAGSDLKIEMKAIKGGSFYRGSKDHEIGRSSDEGPRVEVQIDDFWMSGYEITWDLYQLFVYRDIDAEKASDRGSINLAVDGISSATMPYENLNKPGYPAINMTQHAASTFCKWLTAKTGRFYRLPTEAEWEYACRAGSADAFSFGDNQAALEKYAWYAGNSNGTFQKPGQKLPNARGLYDMHGNVAEWVVDGYAKDAYRQLGGSANPVNFATQIYPRVVRGGSFRDPAAKLRSAARSHSDKSWKRRDPQFPKSLWWHTDAPQIGFRIVRPKVTPSKEEMQKYWGAPMEEY